MSDREVLGMLVQLEATTAQLRREMAAADDVVSRTTRQIDRNLGNVDDAFDRAARGAQQAGTLIRGAFAAIAGAGLVGGIIKQIDSVGQMSDRMRELTGSADEYNLVQDRLLQTAKQTYRPLQEAQELYLLTADSIKSMGYNTQQTLDITDSFSYLLVTSAASADKGRSALDAYSKALMTGKVGAEEWRTILTAMPTVVKALSDATGKSAEEIKKLGVEGKLSLEDLNKGFLSTVEANRAAAERMRASVTDALVNINTALGVYLGRAEDSTGAAGALADALGVVAEHIDIVVAAAGGLLAAGIVGHFYQAAAAALASAKSNLQDAASRQSNAAAALTAANAVAAQTAEQVRNNAAEVANARVVEASAQSKVRKLQATRAELAAQVVATRGTQAEQAAVVALAAADAQLVKAKAASVAASRQLGVALNAETAAMARDTVATKQAAAAKTEYAAASSIVARAGSGLLGLLGGPAGVVALAAGAAASFLLLRDSADDLKQPIVDLKKPFEEINSELEKMSKLNLQNALEGVTSQRAAALDEMKDALQAIERTALLPDKWGEDFDASLNQRAAAWREFERSINAGIDISTATDALLDAIQPSDKLRQSILGSALAYEQQRDAAGSAGDVIQSIKDRIVALTGALDENTASTGANNAARVGFSEGGKTYLETLQKQLAGLQDNGNAIKAAERWLLEHADATEADKLAVMSAAHAIESQKESNKAATAATKDATSETKKQAEQLQDFIAKSDLAVASALRQADAYWKGTDAVSELGRQEKIEAEVLKLGEAAREKITAAVNAEADARERMDLGQHYNQVLAETEAIEAQITATLQGADALEAYNVEKALAAQLAGKNADALTKESEQLRKAMADQRKSAQDLEKIGRSGSVMDRLYPESKLMKDFIKDQEALLEARRRAEEANDPAAVARYTKALEDLGIEYEGNKRDATAWGKLTNEAIDRVDEAFANAWKGIFDGADNLWDGLKEGFKQTLAELAHMAITKPIIISFANQVLRTNTKGGISDVWGSLFGGGETIGDGGGSGGGLGNIFGIAKNLYSLYDTLTGVVPAAWTGFQNGGLSGGLSAIGNHYGGAIGKVISAVFGETATKTAAQISSQMGASAAGYSSEIIAQWAAQQAAQTTAQSTATSMLSSVLKSVSGTLTNPVTWITAGVMASWKLYDNGTKASTSGVRSSFKGANDYAQVIGKTREIETYGFQLIDKFREIENWMLHPLPSALIGGERLAAISTGSPVFQAVSQALGRLLGGGERFKTTVGSAVGSYSDGKYTGQGELVGWYDSAKRFGSDVDEALHGINEAFSSTLGDLLEMFDIEQQIETEASFRLRRTSGKLATVFAVTIDDAVMMMKGQYSKDGNVAKGLEKFLDDVMGRGLAQAIGISDLPAYLKELTAGLKKAEEVSAVIGGLFQRFEGVNATLEAINLTAFGLTDAGLRAADSLLDLSSAIAGLENPTAVDKLAALGSLTSAYYENFFSESERFDAALAAAKKQIESVDIAFPDSGKAFQKMLDDIDRSAFRAMVEDIDLTTEAGRQMFATMMQLAGQVDAYFDLVEQKAANTLAGQMNAANGAFALVQRSISAEQQRLTAEYQAKVAQMEAAAQAYAQAAQAQAAAQANNLQTLVSRSSERVGSIKGVIGALDQALEQLRDTSEETTKQLRAQAVATVQQALAGVKAGRSVLEFPGLEEALERASDMDGETYQSLEAFQREQGRTANMVAELRGLSGKQLTAEELVLQNLEAQLSVARSHASASGVYYSDARIALDREYEQAMEALEKELDEAQRQMDALNGIDNSVMSVVDAVNAMNASVTAALKFMGTGSSPAATGDSTAQVVDRMYKAIAGFAPDAGGINHWVGELTSGRQSYADFIKALEAARVPAFATGGLHAGGLRLVGENGPELEVTGPSRIYSASQTAAMLSGGAAEEVRALRADFAGVTDALRSIAKHTQQTARRVETLERWDGDGMPGERTA